MQATPGSLVTTASASWIGAPGAASARADADDARAVHLAQEDRRRAHRLGEQRPVGGDRAGVVADRGAEVHRRVAARC